MSNAIKTVPRHTFHSTGDVSKKQNLFSVMSDVPLLDALNSASDMLDSLHDPIYAAALGEQPLKGSHAWLVLHALNSAKAVIDSLWQAVEHAEDAANAQQPAKV